MELKIIGYVESCFRDKFGTPRQPGLIPEARGFLRILPEFQPQDSLQGLEDFSHLWVLFVFHKNHQDTRFHAKVHPPRLGGDKVGVFATRSPHRPNPVGLSLLKIEELRPDGIWVSGLDLIDQTPILDIKPYLPYAESRAEAQGGWAPEAPETPWQVNYLCRDKLETWKRERPEIEALITKTLQMDPRPQVYKGYEGQESPYRSHHAVRLHEGDVHFRFCENQTIEVFDIYFMNDEFRES